MNGWMFFPSPKDKFRGPGGDDPAARLLAMLMDSGSVTAEEWRSYVPESRESLQGKSLGFFCGGAGLAELKHGPASKDMPEFPMPVFVSDFSIMPSCWSFNETLTVPAEPVLDYLVPLMPNYRKVITVTSTLPDRPPCYAVYGSYCFFPPPYVMKENPKG